MAGVVKVTPTGKSVMARATANKGVKYPKWIGVGVKLTSANEYLAETGSVALANEATSTATQIKGETKGATRAEVATPGVAKTTYQNDTIELKGEVLKAESGGVEIMEVGLFDAEYKKGTYGRGEVETGGVVKSGASTELILKTNVEASELFKAKAYLQVRNEVMEITSATTQKKFVVVRAQNGTSASTTIEVGDSVTYGSAPGPYEITGTEGTPPEGSVLFARASLETSELLALKSGDTVTYTWKVQFS